VIVCICRGVSQKRVLETIDAGAGNVGEIGRRCGAGTDCGTCTPLLQQTLDARRSDRACTGRSAAAINASASQP
jgi:bacterioferritin-associated ferredoxin